MSKIVLVTGGFDPIHSGHIKYFETASKLGDKLIVGINSDDWLTRKKGKPFMSWEERSCVISSIKYVSGIISFDDSDETAINAIQIVKEMYPNDYIIFANGGDRNSKNVPEMIKFSKDENVSFLFGVGGEVKLNSSSWILDDWLAKRVTRNWGWYRVIYEMPHIKVKELFVEPGKSLSMQRHSFRNEYWVVSNGNAKVHLEDKSGGSQIFFLREKDDIRIPMNMWHRLENPYSKPVKIIEIQYGEYCIEEDIERK